LQTLARIGVVHRIKPIRQSAPQLVDVRGKLGFIEWRNARCCDQCIRHFAQVCCPDRDGLEQFGLQQKHHRSLRPVSARCQARWRVIGGQQEVDQPRIDHVAAIERHQWAVGQCAAQTAAEGCRVGVDRGFRPGRWRQVATGQAHGSR
jgi:hypothetical protein